MTLDMTLTALALAASLQTTAITADDLSWMGGYWLSCDGRREVSETWSDPRDGVLLGSAATLSNGKLAGFEFSRIAPAGAGSGNVAYFAGVDAAAPVAFSAKEATGTRVVF